MEGSIVYSQRCIYLSINLLFQTTTYVYGNWYIAKKKTINSCSWRATLLLSLPKPWWKPIRIFTEWKGKKNKCIGYVMGWRWNLIIATFCRHWWILFFFFFQIGLPIFFCKPLRPILANWNLEAEPVSLSHLALLLVFL